MLLEGQDCPGDLRQAHLGNIPGGRAQRVESCRCIEITESEEIFAGEIWGSITAAAGQKHIPDTVFQRGGELYLNIEVIQFLQKTALSAAAKLRQIVGHVVLHSIFYR